MKKYFKSYRNIIHTPKIDLKMKLFFILLMSTAINLYASEGYSQKTRLSFNLENTSVKRVINIIETTSEFKFFYKSTDVDLDRKVSLKVTNETIDKILDRLFQKTNTTYKLEEKQILLKSENKSSMNNGKEENSLFQQFKKVAGTVTDNKGMPLAGVTVATINGIYGVTSDFDGKFNLNIPSDQSQIVVSYIGFKTKTIDLKSYSLLQVNITLEEEVSNLNEVVVTGYQTLKKERSVGSVAQVGSVQMESRPGSVNVLQRLEGMAAGLNIASDGSLTIRGGSSISLSNQPLIVIDGFPIQDGSISSVNPEDVASVNILKDAAAAAIWGVKASNGVIVITTKKGKANQKLTVDASAFTSITNKIDYSDMKFMNASDQVDLELELYNKNWVNNSTFGQYINASAPFSLVNEALIYKNGVAPNGDIWTPAQFDKYIADLRGRDIEKSWEKNLLRSPILTTYNVSLATGSEKNTTYASLVYNDNRTAARGTADNRLDFNLNDTYKFNDKIEFNAAMIANQTKQTLNGWDPKSINNFGAYNELLDENGQYIYAYSKDYNRWASAAREAANGIPLGYNPLEIVKSSDKTSETLNLRTRLGLKAEIFDGLTLNTSFQYEKGYTKLDDYQTMDNYNQRLRVSNLYSDDPLTTAVDVKFNLPVGTRYAFQRSSYESWYWRNTANWDKTFGKHKITIFAGTDISKRLTEGFGDRKYGYDKQTRAYIPVNDAGLQARIYKDWRGNSFAESSWSTVNSDNRELSWYATGAYEFNNKYALNGSFRIDQKNLFGSDPKFRYKPLWSAGASWNINKEEFMADVDWVNNLRLRTTIGINGNASTTSSPYAKANPISATYGSNLYNFLNLASPPNPQLTWEETRVYDFGLDFGLFKNRLSGTFDYYSKNSNYLLGDKALDPTVGFTSALVNYASMSNKGVELTINGKILKGEGFNWNASANISYNDNKVTDIIFSNQDVRTIVQNGKIEIGQPLSNIWSYNYAGLDNTGNILLRNLDGTTKDWNGSNVKEEELINHGTTVAPWYGGLTNTFAYKGFDLTVNLVYKFGFVFRQDYGYGYDAKFGTLMNAIWKDRWMQPGDELTTRIPKISYNGVNPYNGKTEYDYYSSQGDWYWKYSQDNVLKGDFIRVRDLILGYTVPKRFVDHTFFSNLRFTGQVTNPWLWVRNDRGVDPEAIYTMAYDNLKTYTLGFRATF